MIKISQISCVAVSVLLMLAAVASCSKEGNGGETFGAGTGRITLRPKVDVSPWGLKGTKSSVASDSISLHGDYSIYTSAYYTDTEFPGTDGNFFTGMKFDDEAGDWKPGTPVYWPAFTGGNGIDFLAVATDTTVFKMSELAVWGGQNGFLHGERNVNGVRITVPSGNDTTEILYATASQKCNEKMAVEMNFKHTQCCLEFHIHSNLNNLARMKNIYVQDAYTTGELTILTHPFESVTWNTTGNEQQQVRVPGVIEDTPITKDETLDYHVVVLPQERRDISLFFSQISSLDDMGYGLPLIWQGLALEVEYTTTTEAKKWEAGKKYIFDVTIKFGEIIIVPTVAEWTDGPDIEIPV